MHWIVCPHCRAPLQRAAGSWSCAQGHGFDVAREGYVNLLPVQQKHSAQPGDSAASLAARRAFLEAGHYAPLLRAVTELLRPLRPRRIVDLGCGEGYYTAAIAALAAEKSLGLDISKPAVRMAARRHMGPDWVVASGAAMPLADAATDLVTHLFTQLHVAELARTIRPAGHALVVTPGPRHLWQYRAALFGEVQAHDPEKFRGAFEADFDFVSMENLAFPLRLDAAALQQLLAMTPYAWKARPERRANVQASQGLDTEAAFSLLLFRRRAGAVIG